MTSSRSFPRSLAVACAAVSLALSAAPAADAALEPAWLDNTTLADSGSDASAPLVAASHGRTVVVWKQSDGSHTRLTASIRDTDGIWSAPTYLSAAGHDLNYTHYHVAAATNGDLTAVWCEDGGGLPVYSRTLANNSTVWTDQQLLADGDGGWDLQLASRSDGSLVASYASNHGTGSVRAVRAELLGKGLPNCCYVQLSVRTTCSSDDPAPHGICWVRRHWAVLPPVTRYCL